MMAMWWEIMDSRALLEINAEVFRSGGGVECVMSFVPTQKVVG